MKNFSNYVIFAKRRHIVMRTPFVELYRCVSVLFSGDDSLAGANFCARTALDASIGIDVVDIAFRDSVNGADGLASATSHARVCDYVSHDRLILVVR